MSTCYLFSSFLLATHPPSLGEPIRQVVEWIKAKYCEEKFRNRESLLAKGAKDETSSDTGSDDGWVVKKQDSHPTSTKSTSPAKPTQKVMISPRRVRESFYIPDGWVQDNVAISGGNLYSQHKDIAGNGKAFPAGGEGNGHQAFVGCGGDDDDDDDDDDEDDDKDDSEYSNEIQGDAGEEDGSRQLMGSAGEQMGRSGQTYDGVAGNSSTGREPPLDHLELDRAQKRLIKNRNKKSSGHKSWESLLKPLQTQKEKLEEIERSNSLSEDKEQRRIIKKNLQDIKRAKKSKDEGAKSWKSLLENLEEDKTKPGRSTKQGHNHHHHHHHHHHGGGQHDAEKDSVAFLNDGGAAGDSKKGNL